MYYTFITFMVTTFNLIKREMPKLYEKLNLAKEEVHLRRLQF